jgi:hypothetical protein
VPAFFCPKTLAIAARVPVQLTVGVVGVLGSEVSLFERLDRAMCQAL